MAVTLDTTGSTLITVGATSASVDITTAATGATCYALLGLGINQPGDVTWTGWTKLLEGDEGTSTHYAFYKRVKVAGDTTFTVSWGTSTKGTVGWASYTGQDASNPDENAAVTVHTASSTGYDSGTATPAGKGRTALMACFARSTTSANQPETWTASAELTERLDTVNAANPWIPLHIADSNGPVDQISHLYTAILSSGESHGAGVLIYLVPAAPVGPAPTVAACAGFGMGTTAGWATGNVGNKVFDTVSTPTLVTTNPRTGGYNLQLTSTTAVRKLLWDTNTVGTGKTRGTMVLYVRFPGSLPGNDVVLAGINSAGAANSWIKYVSVGTKLQAQITSGTARDGPVVVADTWYRLDMTYDVRANPQNLDWMVDGVAQTRATVGTAASTIAEFQTGWDASTTATVDYADLVVSVTPGDFPLGAHRVYLLKADVGDTAAQIGTADSLCRFTSNGGGLDVTFNSANILAALSEVPPTISAAADGVYQRTSGAGNAVGIPMTSYQMGSGEQMSGCRIVIPGWSASAVANAIEMRAYNGSAESVLFPAADPNFDNSTTTPAWLCKMFPGVTSQATMDALVVRLGYSTSIVPAPGAHAVYAEVAIHIDPVPTTVVAPSQACLSRAGRW